MERLDIYLSKTKGITRSKACDYIKRGLVLVNNIVASKAGQVVREFDNVVLNVENDFVSRASEKLFLIKDKIGFNVQDKVVLDIGASTGGFTQVCLNGGAKKVYSVDVGSGQLHEDLKTNPKVVDMEKTDIRNIKKQDIDEVDIVVCDVSFISVCKIASKIKELLKTCGLAYILIKPQFECGKQLAKKFRGVVKDEKICEDCKNEVINFFATLNFKLETVERCLIAGSDGNLEYVAVFKNM